MQTVLKTLLACALALGFLIIDAHSKPSIAFLGLSRESDPNISETLARRIQFELSADTGLFVFSKEEVAMLFAKGILNEPEAGPLDMPRLSKGLGAQYYAFGKLQAITNSGKRTWWKPWTVNVKWSQGLRLRVLDASTGMAAFDGVVSGEYAEKDFLTGPEPWEKMEPLARDHYLQILVANLSVESAKAVAKAVKEKSNPAPAAAAPEGAAAAPPTP